MDLRRWWTVLARGTAAAAMLWEIILPAAEITVTGELKQWHLLTLDVRGPQANESDSSPNPFTDYRYDVTFTHESGAPTRTVPGYFAADGNAANTGANAGDVWRAHFAPEKTGRWNYRVTFRQWRDVAIGAAGAGWAPVDGESGSFVVAPTDKSGRDFRAKGRLEYVGRGHLRFAGSGEYFLKAGPDSPETLLAYRDFDDTSAGKPDAPLKTWEPHVRDWREGDPTWREGKGKGLIGALNYLASQGMNTISFLPYNAGGDGDNVWPFAARNDKLHYDCSKLAQWAIVFEHAQRLGLHLHFKLQENEIDDHRVGPQRAPKVVPEALDGGALGPERKLYLREMVARFGQSLAMTWNLGEENTQTPEELRAMSGYLRELQGWPANIVVHTFTNEQELVYGPLLGPNSPLTGVSLQNDWKETHAWTAKWVNASRESHWPWVVSNDEQGHWAYGVPPDPGYAESTETVADPRRPYSLHHIRKLTLWGNLMAGGAGVEYYFGYRLPQQDIDAEDFRSREQSWRFCRIALEFFRDQQIPFWEMRGADERMGNSVGAESAYCLAKPGELYLVYLPWGDVSTIDLRDDAGEFTVKWFNPRTGGALQDGAITTVRGGQRARLGSPPSEPEEDWVILIRR